MAELTETQKEQARLNELTKEVLFAPRVEDAARAAYAISELGDQIGKREDLDTLVAEALGFRDANHAAYRGADIIQRFKDGIVEHNEDHVECVNGFRENNSGLSGELMREYNVDMTATRIGFLKANIGPQLESGINDLLYAHKLSEGIKGAIGRDVTLVVDPVMASGETCTDIGRVIAIAGQHQHAGAWVKHYKAFFETYDNLIQHIEQLAEGTRHEKVLDKSYETIAHYAKCALQNLSQGKKRFELLLPGIGEVASVNMGYLEDVAILYAAKLGRKEAMETELAPIKRVRANLEQDFKDYHTQCIIECRKAAESGDVQTYKLARNKFYQVTNKYRDVLDLDEEGVLSWVGTFDKMYNKASDKKYVPKGTDSDPELPAYIKNGETQNHGLSRQDQRKLNRADNGRNRAPNRAPGRLAQYRRH